MKKYFIIVLILCLFSLSIISCDSVTYNCAENETSSSWNMSYAKFNGSKSKNITLNKESELDFDITSYDGTLSIIIQDEDDNIIYESDEIATSNFKVPIKNPGEYELIVKAEDHNGSFNISW